MDQNSIKVINTLGDRLQALTGNIDFRSDESALESPEQLMAMCIHNSREFKRIEAMDAEHQQRIWNLIASILAGVLQEEAIQKYGNTDGSSIRQVLYGWFNRPESQAFWDRLRQTTKLSLLNFSLTEEQIDTVMKDIFDKLPQVMMEVIEELTSPLTFMPQANAQSIASALTDLLKEVEA